MQTLIAKDGVVVYTINSITPEDPSIGAYQYSGPQVFIGQSLPSEATKINPSVLGGLPYPGSQDILHRSIQAWLQIYGDWLNSLCALIGAPQKSRAELLTAFKAIMEAG